MKENENIDPMLEAKATCLGGCLTMVVIGVLLAIVLFLASYNGAFERKDPRAVTYLEKVSGTDSTEIWRNVKYELVNVLYDTVPKVRKERSTLEPEILAPKVQTMPKDRVDLNDYLGSPCDETDWNYTEIDDEAAKYLDDLGIYWDSNKECWRKRK